MNLEVVRGRAARGGADVSSISRFAESASGELERAAELVQALLELARPLSEPVDLWVAMRPMVVLHHALARAGEAGAITGGEPEREGSPASVTLAPRGPAALGVATDPSIARVPARVSCQVEARGGGDVVATLRCGGPVAPLDDWVRGTIDEGGVRLEMVPDGLMLFFRAAVRD